MSNTPISSNIIYKKKRVMNDYEIIFRIENTDAELESKVITVFKDDFRYSYLL